MSETELSKIEQSIKDRIANDPEVEKDPVLKRFLQRQLDKRKKNGPAAIAAAAQVYIPGTPKHDKAALASIMVDGKKVADVVAEGLDAEFNVAKNDDPRAAVNRLTFEEQNLLKMWFVKNGDKEADVFSHILLDMCLKAAEMFAASFDKAGAEAASKADEEFNATLQGGYDNLSERRSTDFAKFYRIELDEACQLVALEHGSAHMALPIYIMLKHGWNDILSLVKQITA